MFAGRLLGIVATTALELGIDIGSLDAVVTVGFPYTLSGLRQQAGRAGRRNKDCLSMFICDPWPLDQHYAKYPNELYTQPDAEMSLDLDNEIVLEGHLQCAAMEMPLKPEDDEVFFGSSLRKMCEERLVVDDEGFYHSHARYLPFPSKHVPIRNTEDDSYNIIDITDGKYNIIEEEEWSRALFELYEGGIFMHQGSSYIVKEVDHEARTAKVAAAEVNWSTKQRDFTCVLSSFASHQFLAGLTIMFKRRGCRRSLSHPRDSKLHLPRVLRSHQRWICPSIFMARGPDRISVRQLPRLCLDFSR